MKKQKITKRLVSIILALTFCVSIAIPVHGIIVADPENTSRLAGYDRYETAAQITKNGWQQSDDAILAFGENYPDALAAAPLAAKYDAPILLTKRDSLPDATKQTLRDLSVKNVIVVGGTGVITDAVDAELLGMGIHVRRVFGYDRYETAAAIAKELGSPSEVFVVAGTDFPDALSVASIAGIKQIPILLVPQNDLPDAVKNYVNSQSISKSYIIGNSGVISDQIFSQFPAAERISGGTKYQTNLAVNEKFVSEKIFASSSICLATGEIFADALAGSAYAAKLSAPIVLINNDAVNVTDGYVKDRAAEGKQLVIFGGTGILPAQAILKDSSFPPGNNAQQTVTVPPGKYVHAKDYYKEIGLTAPYIEINNDGTFARRVFSFDYALTHMGTYTVSGDMLSFVVFTQFDSDDQIETVLTDEQLRNFKCRFDGTNLVVMDRYGEIEPGDLFVRE